jgi:two-component system, chemotaxis family, sensor kinase CheA
VTQHSDERGAEMRALFFQTAQELLQSLNEEALKLEKNPADAETVRSIRRIVHTLKGDAAACGFRELAKVAHALEDALNLESAATHAALAEIAFKAADSFGAMISAYQGETKLPSTEPLRRMARQLAQAPKTKTRSRKKAADAAGSQTDWSEYEKLAVLEAQNKGRTAYQISAVIDPNCAMPVAGRQLVLNALGPLGDILGTRPEAGSSQNAKHLELLIASQQPVERLDAACRIPTVISQVSVAPLPHSAPNSKHVSEPGRQVEDQPTPEGETNAGAPGHVTPAESILRVDAERIDSVLNLVGELIIGKSMLQQAFTELARHFPKETIRSRFGDAMAFQSRVLGDLQRSVMKIRMVPVEQLFRRFPRMVRDVAKQCGKEVELVVSGQDTDLDKSLLDAAAEPLTHLIRNAVGHGIESGEERVRAGKPAQGTIQLRSYHHGNQVIIEMSDDGRGIDAEKVKAKALQKGLITADEAARLNESEVVELLFRPGFSTAEEVTEVSGRGVGLDVVRSVLHRLKGSVEIETRTGQGTTFRMKLPLTLAIIKALLFRVEQRLYAIPLNTVAEIARAHESDVHQVDGYEVLQLRNKALSLVRLGRRSERPTQAGKIFILVIALGERRLGLIVDALEGEGELVIKALDEQTVPTDLVSGASILGDGRVVLVLNLAAIIERHAQSRTGASAVLSGILLTHADRARNLSQPAGARP